MFVDFRFYSFSEGFHFIAEGFFKGVKVFVFTFVVHFSFFVSALKELFNIIE